MTERDPVLRRLERNGIACCLTGSGVALLLQGGRPNAALAVLAGGVLAGISYWAIKRSIDALTAAVRPAGAGAVRHSSLAWPMLRFVGRYALLGFLAYVMIARLRLHPVGMLAGASSFVAAAAIEAVRFATTSRTGRAPLGR